MNIAFDPWIPVVTMTGEQKLASLCAVLAKGEKFIDLAVRPHERVALMRLFICVAHASLEGPKDYYEWRDIPKDLPGKAQKYLEHWKASFELFHETKPWLQVAGLSKSVDSNVTEVSTEDWTPVSKLKFSLATGNNTTLFDHSGMNRERTIPLAEIVLSMLTYQCFSPGGLISQVYWNGIQSGKSSKDSPCVPSSMMHAFIRGNNLFESIHLNIPNFKDIKHSYGEWKIGKPLWEMLPISMTDLANVENATVSYVGRLVPMKRLIRLHPNGLIMLLGDGLVYPSFIEGFPPEPTVTDMVRKKDEQEERVLLSYRPEKALWRELAALVVKREAGKQGGPLSLRNIQDGKGCDLIVSALARDKATIVDTVESVFPIPSQLFLAGGAASYDEEVKKAESVASLLGWAIETCRNEIDPGWEGRLKSAGPSKAKLKARLHSIATTHYWTTVEKNLQLLLTHIKAIGTENALPARSIWRKMLFASAYEAYRIACGQETPRQRKAFTKGLEKLKGKRKKQESSKIIEGVTV